jgi:hypothetical protein
MKAATARRWPVRPGVACLSQRSLGEFIMKVFAGMSILGLLMGASTPLHAAQYFASVNCGDRSGTTYDISPRQASEGCENSIDFPNYVEAASEADAGGLHADAHGDGSILGQSTAVISDNYLVSAGPGLAGSPGSLVFTYYVHGVTADPLAKGRVLVTVDSTQVYTDPSAAIAFIQYIDGVDTVAGKGALGVAINFDSPNNIETALQLYSERGTIDFDSTVELVAIQALDSAGRPVAATITGDGGFDYSALAASNAAALGLNVSGVPEPSTWAMMLIGFAGLGGAMLKRARTGAAPA